MLFRDINLIKVITGVRRCGKSSLLDLTRMTVEPGGVADRGFASVTGTKSPNPKRSRRSGFWMHHMPTYHWGFDLSVLEKPE